MKTKRIAMTRSMVLAAAILAGSSLQAFARAIHFTHDQIVAFDRPHMTLTIKRTARGEPLRLCITSQTRLFKDGQPAITSDFAVGDEIKGSARKDAVGRLDAVRLYDREPLTS